MIVRKVDNFSLGKIMSVIFAVFGLIVGALFAFVSLMGGGKEAGVPPEFEGILGAGMIIIGFPIGYGISGYFAGIISALIYNVAAGWVGGIELEIEGATHVAPARSPAPAVR